MVFFPFCLFCPKNRNFNSITCRKGLTSVFVIWQIFLLFNILTLQKPNPSTYIFCVHTENCPAMIIIIILAAGFGFNFVQLLFLFVAWNEWCGQFCRYSLSFPQNKLENISLRVFMYQVDTCLLLQYDGMWFNSIWWLEKGG